MSKTATLNLRVDPDVKERAENVLSRLGVPMSTAINVYLTQISLTGSIPFRIALPEAPDELNADLMSPEQLYSELMKGVEDAEKGRLKVSEDVLNQFYKGSDE
ncbi:MAG TPA: type II toxin-antitoxin system RelB/DinJ family antitoxin [Candidatus Avanaerovorax faecigallinarum]|nr:type II toxin-antitoxin system RelB/DinJ family antitoxin [Candidatus Avanaerovorax faecigallinarum]